jgi:hypothetical protein
VDGKVYGVIGDVYLALSNLTKLIRFVRKAKAKRTGSHPGSIIRASKFPAFAF